MWLFFRNTAHIVIARVCQGPARGTSILRLSRTFVCCRTKFTSRRRTFSTNTRVPSHRSEGTRANNGDVGQVNQKSHFKSSNLCSVKKQSCDLLKLFWGKILEQTRGWRYINVHISSLYCTSFTIQSYVSRSTSVCPPQGEVPRPPEN